MNMYLFGAVACLYLAAIGYLGYRGYRKNVNSQDYLVAGRSAHPFVMAMSYGAAFISTSAIVGFGGIAGLFGLGLLWLPFMNIVFGIFVAFVFFGRPTRRIGKALGAQTFPDFLGRRFQSDGIKVASSLIIVLFMQLYSSVVLIGGARFLEKAVNISFHAALFSFAAVVAVYVVMGGLKGVMYVDALMGSIMVIGMLSLLIMAYYSTGGVVSTHQELAAMAPLVPEKLKALGHAGWTVMPRFHSQWWWTLVTSLMLGVGIGALAQPQLAVRFMTVKSDRELNRAVLIGALFILATATVAYVVGALSNVYFMRQDHMLSIQVAGGNPDLIMPMFISRALPVAFLYIFSITLLSAAMSTMSSLFHVTGSSLGHDLYCTMVKKPEGSVWCNRVGILLGI
ncbi:MAG: sodium:solute symporter family protein, partial [Victivallaceae bacterium]|nr:sodium:solute symporter family protein [Victivallaceae bacterium]